jgi:hypothetical protein
MSSLPEIDIIDGKDPYAFFVVNLGLSQQNVLMTSEALPLTRHSNGEPTNWGAIHQSLNIILKLRILVFVTCDNSALCS